MTMIRDEVVQLDIGGVIFRTTKTTLCSMDGYFAAMFRDGNWAEEKSSHPIFIDRDPTTFPMILSYLRAHTAIFSESESDAYLQKLSIETDYYQLTHLSTLIECEIQRRLEDISKKKEEIIYRVVKGTEASSFFSQGWIFVHQYYGNETFGCIATGTRTETIWFGNHCVSCNELMNYEKFIKHTTLFQPVMFVIMKKKSLTAVTASHVIEALNNSAGSLSFDQSFG